MEQASPRKATEEKITKTTTTPQKRRRSEYHDPDYQQDACNKREKLDVLQAEATTTTTTKAAENAIATDEVKCRRRQMLCDIISREFQTELNLKKDQLTQIDERLEQARKLFDRLRFAIVAEYYRKQEVPLTNKVDADTIRGEHTLFSDERAGPQQALHPSLKKIIGKKPKTYDDLMRTQPERTAAAQAKRTIRERNPAQRRHERRIQQIIREQGIVIDHSKEGQVVPAEICTSVAPIKLEPQEVERRDDNDNRPSTSKQAQMQANAQMLGQTSATGKVLNSTRLNNKVKHLFVVGNTSKYIGSETDAKSDNGQTLSHKWLVYVQGKDMQAPLDTYLKKVRFHLHHSYRPNDVVDVHTPPFQIARRGWGEFPMRIQLYFHEQWQQKPVQLLHNLVLDKTLSGLHTLGAETVVEVWLRTLSTTIANAPVLANTKPAVTTISPIKHAKTASSATKTRKISITHNKEELDDNLFGFINKMDVSADIEKIQPTVLVPESLACKLSSPLKANVQPQPVEPAPAAVPIQLETTTTMPPVLSPAQSTLTTISSSNNAAESSETIQKQMTANVAVEPTQSPQKVTKTSLQILPKHMPTTTKPAIVYLPKPVNNVSLAINNAIKSNSNNIFNNNNNNINNNNINNNNNNNNNISSKPISGMFINLNGKKFILSHTSALQSKMVNGNAANIVAPSPPANTIGNVNKLVRFVDAQGKVKFLPMVVKPTTAPTTQIKTALPAVTPTNIVSQGITKLTLSKPLDSKPSTTTLSPTITAKVNPTLPTLVQPNVKKPTKNIVFQKEGKLYIIDPLQVKLKQAQRKQQSLLKPQISLLKQNQPQQVQKQMPTVTSNLHAISSDHDYAPVRLPQPSVITLHSTMPSAIFLNTRQARLNTESANLLLQKQRMQFELRFQRAQFSSMRAAVEYLLRRLPIYAERGMPAAAFPFVCRSLKEFQALNAIKQRACESLRAKLMQRFMHKHVNLKCLVESDKEPFWSTRELIVFARLHAYTPRVKTIASHSSAANVESEAKPQPFATLVQCELKQEQQQYDTLTNVDRMNAWLSLQCQDLALYEDAISKNEIIDVVDSPETATRSKGRAGASESQQQSLSHMSLIAMANEEQLYLPTPAHLDGAAQLVSDTCKAITITMSQTEELMPGVLHPKVLTVLAQATQLFAERLLRQSIAAKLQQMPETVAEQTLLPLGVPDDLTLTPQDICRVISQCSQFDFLANCHLGAPEQHEKQDYK